MGCEVDLEDIQENKHSNTKAVTFYSVQSDNQTESCPTFLVDTPGLRDTNIEEQPNIDQIHKQELIKAFQASKATHFHGIFWFCKDNKRTPELVEQARLIDDLVQPYLHQPGEHAPCAKIDKKQRVEGWKHVVIMLYPGAKPRIVRQIIEEITGNDIIGKQVRSYSVGLRLGSLDIGACDVCINAEVDSEDTVLDCTLQYPTKADILSTFFSSIEPIRVGLSFCACNDIQYADCQ